MATISLNAVYDMVIATAAASFYFIYTVRYFTSISHGAALGLALAVFGTWPSPLSPSKTSSDLLVEGGAKNVLRMISVFTMYCKEIKIYGAEKSIMK